MNLQNLKPVKPEEVEKALDESDFLWLYKGKPRKEALHVLLASKNHSDGFAMVGELIKKTLPSE